MSNGIREGKDGGGVGWGDREEVTESDERGRGWAG